PAGRDHGPAVVFHRGHHRDDCLRHLGVLLARQGRYSLFGAFVLASLPAVGGGILRDIIVNRERPAVLSTPAYVVAVLLTVLVCFFLFQFKSRRRTGANPST